MNRKVKKSEKDSLEILREYLTYRDDDRDALLKRIPELEIEIRRMEMALVISMMRSLADTARRRSISGNLAVKKNSLSQLGGAISVSCGRRVRRRSHR